MAWTTPLDWTGISNDIVTAAQLNQQVRDNLNVLSTHQHTGAAGQGAASMSGLTLAALATLTFANQSANPDAAGELQRNGNDLLFYGSSAVNLTAADASAGTASLRSLGTTAVKAAAGNHEHTIATPDSTNENGSDTTSISSTRNTREKAYTDTQVLDGCSKTITVTDQKNLVIVVAFLCLEDPLELADVDMVETGGAVAVIQDGMTLRMQERIAGSSTYQSYAFNVIERTNLTAALDGSGTDYRYELTASASVTVTCGWIYATVCQV
jgi:hypothetical protein